MANQPTVRQRTTQIRQWNGATDAYGATGAAFGEAVTPIIGAWAPIGKDWKLFRYMYGYESLGLPTP